MPKWSGKSIELTRSARGSLRCAQACFIMAVQALKNMTYTMHQAEERTGFTEGKLTWPHKGFLSFAALGVSVTSIENVDVASFAENPEQTLKNMVDDPAVLAYLLKNTDIPKEKAIAQACLNATLISFIERPPKVEDIEEALRLGALPLAVVDFNIIHDNVEPYEGHMVIITAVEGGIVTLVDPGPPGGVVTLSIEKFKKALFAPTPTSGQVIILQEGAV